MESNTKLWRYIYYDQKMLRHENGNKYFDILTKKDDCKIDQLCNQLLLNNDKKNSKNLYSFNHDKSLNHPNYCNLQFASSDPNYRKTIFKRIVEKSIFYKYSFRFNHFITLLIACSILIFGFIYIVKVTGFFQTSLPYSSFSIASFQANHTYFYQIGINNKLANEYLDSFDRILTVETECASYIGTVEESSFEFLGIQYATPPLNKLRFKPTIPIWNDSRLCKPKQIKKAKKFSQECFQINPFSKKFHGNEDCLYLNIWTPRIDSLASLNVMIYFHPGFLQFGSGHLASDSTLLSPSASLAKKLNIVFVSFNYRLDALGFFPAKFFVDSKKKHQLNKTDEEQKPSESEENYALYDQLTAIEWVKRNIRRFGGNPNRLTVFGSDGGGASILALLSNQKFKESISKVWLAGPAVYFNKRFSLNKFLSKNNHEDKRMRSLRFDSCKTIECFQNLSAKEVIIGFLDGDEAEFKINDQNDLPINGIYPNQWIQVDNKLVNDAYPFDRTLNYNKLQLLIGTSTNSIEWWPGPNDLHEWSWFQYIKYVTTSLDSFNSTISKLALQKYSPNVKISELNGEFTNRKIKKPFDLIKQLHKKKIYNSNQQDRQNDIDQLNNGNSDIQRLKLSPESLYTRMVSDIKQTCPINTVSKNLVKFHNSTVFRYIATSGPSYPVKLFGHKNRFNFHLFDLIAFFDQTHLFIENRSPEDLLFVKQMQNLVINFVQKNEYSIESEDTDVLEIKNLINPLGDDFKKIKSNNSLRWSAYPKSIALINKRIEILKDYNSERCKFWESIGLDKYAWVC